MIRNAYLPHSRETLDVAAECLRAVAHPHRLQMLQLLLSGNFTVSELAAACEIAGHMASEHLTTLRLRGVIRREREGHRVYYQVVNRQRLTGILQFLELEQETTVEDVAAVLSKVS